MKRQSVSPIEGRSTRPALHTLTSSRTSVCIEPTQRPVGRLVQSTRYACGAMVLGALLAACSSPDPHAIDYQTSGRHTTSKAPSLAAPPDLMDEDRSGADVPAGGQASLSGYQTSGGTPDAVQQVLPQTAGLHIEQDGSQRWLVVSTMPAAQLWGQIRAFWQAQGFFLTEDAENRGIMQTDWKESRARLDQGLIRNTLTFAVDNSYVAAERNRFRTRIEAGPNGETYVFISQQGLHEQLSPGSSNENSQWVPKPNDPGLEAEYLTRLQRSLAQGPQTSVMSQQAADAAAAANASARAAAVTHPEPSAAEPAPPPPGVSGGDRGVVMSEDYDHAWAHVGTALDRANFTVDDRNREKGLYYIRYADPNNLGTAAQGFWSQLFHGKKEKVATPFQINVRAITPTQTVLAVRNDKGEVDTSPLAEHILRLVVSAL